MNDETLTDSFKNYTEKKFPEGTLPSQINLIFLKSLLAEY